MTLLSIADAARFAQVPAGTVRRWLSEGRLTRHGQRKPYQVDVRELVALRTLMSNHGASRVE